MPHPTIANELLTHAHQVFSWRILAKLFFYAYGSFDFASKIVF
jgi:hypothetical protein